MKIGIRREDKNEWEARVPLTPSDAKKIIDLGIEIILQPSHIRIFSDQEYINVGATISEDLSECSLILAVKEIPIDFIEEGKVYLFFSHTIKGQEYNMALLQTMIDKRTQLLDYERIIDNKGRRLIFFGRHAGLAGMIDTLWALGQQLKHEGINSPFSKIKKTYEYRGLENAKEAVSVVSDELQENGMPEEYQPLIVGFSGYGNVSQGAQEIFDILPHKELAAEELIAEKNFLDKANVLYKTVFKEGDMVEPLNPSTVFELQDYYDNPEKYRSRFKDYLPKLTILVNCIFWDTKYPRLVTLDWMKQAWEENKSPQLKVIGDISCDIEGAIQCTTKVTDPGSPVYTYNPINDKVTDGIHGPGPVVMAVDNLPCELAEEASETFSTALVNFIPQLIETDFNVAYVDLKLPPELLSALILHNGNLTDDYKYLKKYL
jgi:alpha-aminoadipic semialdehyde synthase